MEWQEVTAEPGRGLSEFNRDPGCRGVTARDGTGLKTHELQSGIRCSGGPRKSVNPEQAHPRARRPGTEWRERRSGHDRPLPRWPVGRGCGTPLRGTSPGQMPSSFWAPHAGLPESGCPGSTPNVRGRGSPKGPTPSGQGGATRHPPPGESCSSNCHTSPTPARRTPRRRRSASWRNSRIPGPEKPTTMRSDECMPSARSSKETATPSRTPGWRPGHSSIW